MKKNAIVIVLAITAIVTIIALAACASSGSTSGKGASGSGASGDLRLVFREIPAVTKAAFDTLDPVFQRNLKPNAAIAVFPISTDSNDDSEAMYAELQILIVNSNRYTIVEKRHVDGLLAEHDFQQSGLVSETTAVDFGKLLGADAVILGAVGGKGSDRELSLVAVDMQNRKTLAVAREPWPQAYEGGARGRAAAGRTFPADMGLGNVLVLPPMGGSREENITLGNLIASLRDINDACNLIDESANTSLLPASFNGTRYEDGELLFKLALQHKANYIIHSNIQKFGQRNLAIISRYNTMTRLTDSVYYLDYIDPVEAWIKLPRVVSTIMKLTGEGKEGAFKTYNFWLRYKDGVDRALVDRAVGMLVNDYAEAGRSGTLRNFTVALENMITARQGDPAQNRVGDVLSGGMRRTLIPDGDWKTYMDKLFDDIRNQRSYNSGSANDAFNDLYFGAEITRDFSMVDLNVLQRTVDGDVFFIEASRNGNRTRLHFFKLATPSAMVTLDFTDIRDFIRQMRGLSLSIANGKPTAGYDLGIIRGEKWNYWKYAGEDSSIPDIITYVKQFPKPPEFRSEYRGTNNAHFQIPLSGDILLYYAKENDFSKAVLADIQPIRVNNITYQWRIRNAFNLEPKTQYYFWAVSCWGHLLWLQSEPTSPVMVNTRDGRVTF